MKQKHVATYFEYLAKKVIHANCDRIQQNEFFKVINRIL